MYDMCLCASEECPRYNSCLRGNGTKRIGIYTSSFLAEICNKDSNYSEYIPVEYRKDDRRIMVILGATATGKTQIVKILQEKYGLNKVVTWTTRPRRRNEIGGVDYNFCDIPDFKVLEKNGFFAETTSFVMADGQKVFYGTPIEELKDQKVIILNPHGFHRLNKLNCLNITSFLIESPVEELKKRLAQRGDCKAEILRRLNADENDFYGIEDEVNHKIINDGSKSLEEIADEIYKKYIGEKNE